MTTPTALARPSEYSAEQVELIRKTIAPDLDDNELALFVEVCKRQNLDPFRREIYAQKRLIRGKNGAPDSARLVFITGIDGYRARAASTGELDGHRGPEWCGPDGVWKDVWLDEQHPPAAARVIVYRKGCREGFPGIARYRSYVQTQPDWQNGRIVGHRPVDMWLKMPDNQLAKCAEALALRKAFPNELGELYTREEMDQADNELPAHALPAPGEQTPSVKTWDGEVFNISGRIKAAKKRGEMNAIAADIEKCRKDGMPDALVGALRKAFDERMAQGERKPEQYPTQDYVPTNEEIAELQRERDEIPFR